MASCRSLPQFIIIVIIIVLPVSIKSQQSSTGNVTLPSSIVANNNPNPTWTSPSGRFAFGFRQVTNGSFLLAIWFDQIPEKPIVWSANRDEPVPLGSRVQLSAQGALALYDGEGKRIWDSSRLARSGVVAYASMLDTGNFILATNTSVVVWQSFDTPTDTLLPGQRLDRDGVLVSSFSETNYSRGRFKLTMQTDGNLALYTRGFPLDDGIDEYWSSDTDTGSQLIFNQSGSIYIIGSNGTILKPLSNTRATEGSFHQMVKLEYDGVLRYYLIYPNYSSVDSFIPPNICMNIREKHTGGGACGYNSVCLMGTDGRPSCSCPPHYSPKGGVSGCVPDFGQHRCDQESSDAKNFVLNVMYNVDWPDVDYANFYNVEEDWCRQSCLNDCNCAVAVSYSKSCFMKSIPFANGVVYSNLDLKAFVKVRINSTMVNTDTHVNPSIVYIQSKNSSNTLVITLSVLLGISVLFYLLSSVIFVLYFKRKEKLMFQESRVRPGLNMIRRFSFEELQEATQGFKDELGRGSCSKVYKGKLKENDQDFVAVKKLEKMALESDREFVAEVSCISKTNHKNLVQLLGYCDEGDHKILVYEFMANGSLSNFLFQNSRLNWYRRRQIAFEIVRGLCYLHEECTTPIIHCDIKPQNILLDGSCTPKISDFGLSKLLRPDQTRTTTGIRGTRGYVAPEWFRNMAITVKVDVYSYGILLLELLCCRKNYEKDVEDEGEVVLVDWAYDCYQEDVLDVLVEGDEEAKSDMKMVERTVMTAIWCVQEDPALRPCMKRVMHMLEGSIEVPVPPNPTVFIS